MTAFYYIRRFLCMALAAIVLLSSCSVTQDGSETDPSGSANGLARTNVTAGFRSPAFEFLDADWQNDWRIRLVNVDNPLSDSYSFTGSALTNGLLFDARAIGEFNDMIAGGRDEGLDFVICSAYRSVEYQQQLFDQKVEAYLQDGYGLAEAYSLAAAVISPPGASEHNLGLAADIVSMDYQHLDDEQESTPETQWLHANCHKYGFVLRYPEDKQDITGIIYEPWHYRYVGVDIATYMYENELCLEELWQELSESEITPLSARIPNSVSEAVVFLDAGHGGIDPGAEQPGCYEKDITLSLTLLLGEKLSDLGIGALYSRTDDSDVDLLRRAELANDSTAHIFVSIHANSYEEDASVRGIETYYSAGSDAGASLASFVQTSLVSTSGADDRGTKPNSDYTVLLATEMPAILIETGFMTNAGELTNLLSPQYQETLASAIAEGIYNYIFSII